MFLFDLLLIVIFVLVIGNFFKSLGGRRRQSRLSPLADSLKETQNLSKVDSMMAGMSLQEQQHYQDSMTISVCFARFALQVAQADGYVSGQEIQSIFGFFRGADSRIREHLEDVISKDLQHPASIDWSYNQKEALRILAKSDWREFSAVMFDGLLKISMADGALSQHELETIFLIMSDLGWSQSRMQSWFQSRTGFDANFANGEHSHESFGGQYRHRATSSGTESQEQRLDKAFNVLGLPTNADGDAIRRRYRELARENHPDRYAQLGEEIQKTATARFQVIQEAYDFLQKNRN